MQALEVIIFLIFAIIAATLILAFIAHFNFSSIWNAVFGIFVPEDLDQKNYEKINFYAFLNRMSNCWQSCAYGAMDMNCGVFYVTDSNKKYSKADLAQLMRKLNICETCNVKIDKEPLEFPALVALGCDSHAKALVLHN